MSIPTYRTNRTGAQVSDALQQMNERIPEGWAVGAADGVPVSSGSPFWHNNAKYYAEKAGEEAARAEAAVPAGTEGAVFFTVDQSDIMTEAQKAVVRKNIRAGGSNRNLLDNWYFVGGGSQLGDGVFPINQRGQTSYSAYVNSIDRWYAAAAMTVAADGISCGTIVQKLPQVANLNGKTLTFSALMADGTMLSGSAVFNSASDTYFYSASGEFLFYNTYFGGFEVVTAKKIAAVKLELGTVSTLANDVLPNYWTELQKCKARLRFVPLTRCPIVFAAGNAYLDLNGCEMEGAPIAALYSNQGAVVGSSGASSAITSVALISIGHNVPLLQFNLASAINDQVGQIYNTVVQLSSEL